MKQCSHDGLSTARRYSSRTGLPNRITSQDHCLARLTRLLIQNRFHHGAGRFLSPLSDAHVSDRQQPHFAPAFISDALPQNGRHRSSLRLPQLSDRHRGQIFLKGKVDETELIRPPLQ